MNARKKRTTFRVVLLLAASGFFAAAGQWSFRWGIPFVDGALLIAVAVAFLVRALPWSTWTGRSTLSPGECCRPPEVRPRGESGGRVGRRIRRRHAFWIGISAAGALICNAYALTTLEANAVTTAGAVSFVFSVILAVGAVWAIDLSDSAERQTDSTTVTNVEAEPLNSTGPKVLDGSRDLASSVGEYPSPLGESWLTNRYGELATIVVLVLVAAFFRLYRLDQVPYGLWYDEAINGLYAQTLGQNGLFPVYFEADFGRAPLLFYVVALLSKMAGASVFTLRLAEAVAGILSISVFYKMSRQFLGLRVAIVATALLSISRWYVNFSRIAFDVAFAVLFICAVLYWLARAMRTGRLVHYAFAGVAVSLGMYTYQAFRLFPIAIAIFVVHKLIFERRELRRVFLGAVAFTVLAGLTISPLALYGVRNTETFTSRASTTSVFKGVTTLDGAREVLWRNVQEHLLMFNTRGDPNGRHNLPDEPMLDNVTGALFLLGIGYAVYHWRRTRIAAYLALFAVMLMGGILTVAFEAPQSLRSIGVIPAVFVFAGLPIGAAWTYFSRRADRQRQDYRQGTAAGTRGASKVIRALSEGPGRRKSFPWAVALSILAAGSFAFVARANYHDYFVRQARDFGSWNAFSTAETAIGRRLSQLKGGTYDIYVSSLFKAHASIRFLVPQPPKYDIFNVGGGTLLETAKNGVVIFLEPQERGAYLQLKKYYPNARFEEVRPEGATGGPFALVVATIGRDDIDALHGVEARYYNGETIEGNPAAKRREAGLEVAAGQPSVQPAPYTVQWQTTLLVPQYERYAFAVEGGSGSKVYVDGYQVFPPQDGKTDVVLAKGSHALRAESTIREQGGSARVLWRSGTQPLSVIAPRFLFSPPATNNGLLGKYYQSADWSGSPALAQIDPAVAFYFHMVPLPRPYSVEWEGRVYAPTDGQYLFGTEQISNSQLSIDGRLLVDNRSGNQLKEAPISLTKGFYDLKLRFRDLEGYSHIYLYWTLPGRARELIPTDYLFPPHGEFAQLALPPPLPQQQNQPRPGVPVPATVPAQDFPALKTLPAPSLLTFGRPGVADGEFNEPRDLAVGKDGEIYVVDTGNQRVQEFAPDGRFLAKWGRQGDGKGEFNEPVALVIDSRGDVLVLDAENGWISRFDQSGKFKNRFAGPEARFYRPRGLAIDAEDNLYVADTGGCRVVVLDPTGRTFATFGRKGAGNGEFLEPTDVLPMPNGELIVVDMGNHRLQRFDGQRQYLGQTPLPSGIAMNATHITYANGDLFGTDPDRHRVVRFDPDLRPSMAVGGEGEEPGQFRLPVGITTSTDGILLVADTLNNRVQKMRFPQ